MVRRIYLLGGLRIFDAQEPVRLTGEKPQSLLAYLLLHRKHPIHRELLAEMLFPDSPPDRGRRNLSAALSRLVDGLGNGWVEIHKNFLALNARAGLWVDVWAFEHLAASSEAADLQKAVDLYIGDLVPELYEEWLLGQRELLRNQFLAALENLSTNYKQRGEIQAALSVTRRLIVEEPLHEPAHLDYLRLLGHLRRYGEAAAHFEYLCRLLQKELRAEPTEETRQVVRAIENEHVLATVEIGSEEKTEFVGRIPERKLALEAVDLMLQGTGGILVVEGEAGIGKSRFMREITAGARWRGATVIYGQASETPEASPFAPLIAALDPIFNSQRTEQLETLLSPETMSALAPLMPGHPTAHDLPDAPSEQAGRRFFNALDRFGELLARLMKLVLIIDDVQWADRTLWESLRALAGGLARGGALLLLAYRRPEIETTTGWEIIRSWFDTGILKIISIPPLNLDEVTQLVADRLLTAPAEIYALTGGNPFLISQWLAEPSIGSASHPITVAHRLPGLTNLAREMLEYAAVLGSQFPYRLWLETAGVAPLTLASASDELTTKQWLIHSASGYEFAHDLIRQAIYQEIRPERCAEIHARVASVYEQLEPENYRSRAFHLDLAGMALEAAVAYRRAGDQDLSRLAFSEAQQAFDRSLTLMPPQLSVERIETALALAQACEITGDRVRQHPAVEEALEGARQMGDPALLLRALFAIGRACGQKSQIQDAKIYLTEALELAWQTQDRIRETELVFELGDLAGQEGKWSEAQQNFHQALDLARAIPDPAREARAMAGLAIVAKQTGNPHDSVKWFEQALAIHRQTGNRLAEMHAQSNLLGALYELGAWDRLIQIAREVLPITEALGNRVNVAIIRQVHGLASYALGDYAGARQLFLEARQEFITIGNRRNAGLVLNTLGLVSEAEGFDEEALQLYQSALANAEEINAANEAAYARHDLGALLVRLERPSEAVALLEASRTAWIDQGNVLLRLKSEAFLGLALLPLGERARAEELASIGLASLKHGAPAGEQPQGWLWALYRLLSGLGWREEAAEVLSSAYVELQRQARTISDTALRQSFFERVPLNRSIMASHDELVGNRRMITVFLARHDSPLGRALDANEFIPTRWTIDAPEDEAFARKSDRRRHRILRLLQEAQQQGASPTDDDLASALGVSRRTILRDMQTMAAVLPALTTRKRMKIRNPQ